MVNALTPLQSETSSEGLILHQSLHGYAEGHRLLESSVPIPDDLKRVMLRMSDLSGTTVVNGFQDYLTGYPLLSMDAYALAKTWYAPEMARPGCVWTHTVIIPSRVMARIVSLAGIQTLFRRPNLGSTGEVYSKPIFIECESLGAESEDGPQDRLKLEAFLVAHYSKEQRPLIIPAANSHEYAALVFAVWSQKWPALRMGFTFSTGSLSARTFERRPLDVQCVPIAATRQVSREFSDAGFGELVLQGQIHAEYPRWAALATDDALKKEVGPLRRFLWSVADENSHRGDFEAFVSIYDSVGEQQFPFSNILKLTAMHFPRPLDGQHLKKALLEDRNELLLSHASPKEILFALATTEHSESFDVSELALSERACHLMTERPTDAYLLVGELLRASVNPFGDEILKSLIMVMRPEDALVFATGQEQFLPTLFRINPRLAVSPKLWQLGGDRRRELFESIAAQPEIEPGVLREIIDAMLESDSDGFIRRAFTRWPQVAVFETLNWSEAHGGLLTANCRVALSFHIEEVANWIATEQEKSTNILASLAYVVAPYTSRVSEHDCKVWIRTLHALRKAQRKHDADFVASFLLALALCNAPPEPLDLVSESFERVHWLAEKQQLRDDAWSVIEPFVPELSWGKNWDRCERMRRALMAAFMLYAWPPSQLRERIKDQDLIRQLLKSARKVDAEHYFGNV